MDLYKIKKIIKNAEYFSGAIQIVENSKIKLDFAAGYAKREDELYNNSDTAFGIASGTKGFTALGILKLIDQGTLTLEDKVFKKLPFEFPNMDDSITVRQLLTHTSGIFDYFDEQVITDFGQLFEQLPIYKISGPKDMLPLLVKGKAYFKPGEKFKYCNSGFVILGILLEALSGMDYSEYIQKEICKPLNIDRTGCFKTNQLPKNCALGYMQDERTNWFSNIFDIPIACTADGGLFTTAADMTKMWQGVMSGSFISKDLLAETFSIQANAGWRENLHYGLGYWIITDDKVKISSYYLTGADPGVSFISSYYVKQKRIVTILGNQSNVADMLQEEISPYLD